MAAWAADAGGTNAVQLWNAATGQLKFTLAGRALPASSVSYRHHGLLLASAVASAGAAASAEIPGRPGLSTEVPAPRTSPSPRTGSCSPSPPRTGMRLWDISTLSR